MIRILLVLGDIYYFCVNYNLCQYVFINDMLFVVLIKYRYYNSLKIKFN